ncbi:MAG: hypothetical protein AUI12_05920 [Acidobacteria bacterium 13_2_20CM_2_57_6]|nr:MAG: hypothetical protein AUI12_05920 [Acidobacteria bacterium 13_2_20CM_2_57_6]
MIGVICKIDQVAVVEEFFELFKTPWEFYQRGRAYEVVVATADDVPGVDARLLILYGAETKTTDRNAGIRVRRRRRGGSLNYQTTTLPIYGDLVAFEENSKGDPLLKAASETVGLRMASSEGARVIRLGYDLFEEAQLLFSGGQPVEHARVPTLDLHIEMIREWILREGILLLEIPPLPADHRFTVCLTHDIDFVGIRNHKFDHTMWGFLYRSTVGALRKLVRGRISLARLFDTWRAVASLPFVYLGWAEDFWSPFEWYLRVEENLAATYFLIPFKRRTGERVPGRLASRRASTYDVGDLPNWTPILKSKGCELGVHGIDAWHSVDKGRAELARISEVAGQTAIGIRMHWLLRDRNTASVLDEAGYDYDSTEGYNETIGYRSGTTQVFRPLGAKTLLELPLHIQDGALFYPKRLDLSESQAEQCCGELIENATRLGGVLTVLWHDRSHGPERFWGGFYARLVDRLKSANAWFATAAQAVSWFRRRRSVRFERAGADNRIRICLASEEQPALPSLRLRAYYPCPHDGRTPASGQVAVTFTDIPWNGATSVEFDSGLSSFSELSSGPSVTENSSHEDDLHADPKLV